MWVDGYVAAALPPIKKPGTHFIGDLIPGPSSPVASRYTDSAIPAHFLNV